MARMASRNPKVIRANWVIAVIILGTPFFRDSLSRTSVISTVLMTLERMMDSHIMPTKRAILLREKVMEPTESSLKKIEPRTS